MEAGLIASLLRFCYIELQFSLHNFAGPGRASKFTKQVANSFTVNVIFCRSKAILGDLKTYFAIEMSQNNTLTLGKLWRCQTKRSNMQITAEIMHTYDLSNLPSHDLMAIAFLLITQYEMSSVN